MRRRSARLVFIVAIVLRDDAIRPPFQVALVETRPYGDTQRFRAEWRRRINDDVVVDTVKLIRVTRHAESVGGEHGAVYCGVMCPAARIIRGSVERVFSDETCARDHAQQPTATGHGNQTAHIPAVHALIGTPDVVSGRLARPRASSHAAPFE